MSDKEKVYLIMPVKVNTYLNIDQKWIPGAKKLNILFNDKSEAQAIANQVNKFLVKVVRNYIKEKENEQRQKEEISDIESL